MGNSNIVLDDKLSGIKTSRERYHSGLVEYGKKAGDFRQKYESNYVDILTSEKAPKNFLNDYQELFDLGTMVQENEILLREGVYEFIKSVTSVDKFEDYARNDFSVEPFSHEFNRHLNSMVSIEIQNTGIIKRSISPILSLALHSNDYLEKSLKLVILTNTAIDASEKRQLLKHQRKLKRFERTLAELTNAPGIMYGNPVQKPSPELPVENFEESVSLDVPIMFAAGLL
jgi:hypothetical protein